MNDACTDVPLGPLMVDLRGETLTADERDLLRHPAVGGVILFARNYRTPEQLTELTRAIRAARRGPLLIAVDQEGGRVQRFLAGFTPLSAASELGQSYATDPDTGLRAAEAAGYCMASELRRVGVDLSFAPVLDLDYGQSAVIGSRAFHSHPEAVAALGAAFRRGMRRAGMAAVGKHFPGHGAVTADSHVDRPVDHRPMVDLERADLVPFARLIEDDLEGVMAAHVVYPAVCPEPASLSRVWLRDVLRERLGFRGAVFSDDLTMTAAADAVPDPAERVRAALDAGCDMALLCNRPEQLPIVADALGDRVEAAAEARLRRCLATA